MSELTVPVELITPPYTSVVYPTSYDVYNYLGGYSCTLGNEASAYNYCFHVLKPYGKLSMYYYSPLLYK